MLNLRQERLNRRRLVLTQPYCEAELGRESLSLDPEPVISDEAASGLGQTAIAHTALDVSEQLILEVQALLDSQPRV